jgi:hypothetical protein
MRIMKLAAVAIAACLPACVGVVSPAGSSGGGPGSSSTTSPQGSSGPIIPARVRRLSKAAFDQSVRQLLGTNTPTAVDFPVDPLSGGYDTGANDLRVTSLLANTLFDTVPALAAQAVMAMAPCDAAACARQLLEDFARRAYRRDPTTVEVDELLGVYTAARTASDARTALTRAVSVILQSPDFLYATELGAPGATGKTITLTPQELATQLSYLLTGMPPDAELTTAAKTGALASAGERETQARRLLKTAQARTMLNTFATQWFELTQLDKLDKDATAFPNWKSQRAQLLSTTQDFFTQHVLDDNTTFSDLLKAGLLLQPAFLAAHAQSLDDSPVQRGHFVRTRMLCQDIPPPPPTLKVTLPPPDPTLTTRERIAAHTASNTCQGCHATMNPIGYVFEGYDAVGHPRTTDNGKPVDTSGALTGTDVDGPLTGPEDLAAKLAQSHAARECFSRHWFQFAFGMSLDTDPARAVLSKEAAGFVQGSQSVRDFMVALVRSDIFSTRYRPEG